MTGAARAAGAALAVAAVALLTGCATAASHGLTIPTTTPAGAVEQIPATLTKPEDPGPFPAVVLMHDCSGLGPASSGAPGRWARELGARGYVTLLPDSFTSRGWERGVCVADPARGRSDVSPARRVRDAYAALAYLRTLPEVDGRRVGLMGGSHGGTTTLSTIAAEDDGDPLARERRAGFAAAVALYPACVPSARSWRFGGPSSVSRVGPPIPYRPVAPLLILIGEKDDWTPAHLCRELGEHSRAAGYPVTVKVYPGAHHSFDSPNPERYVATRINANAPTGRGATTGGNPEAWADSIREVVAFFEQHLK